MFSCFPSPNKCRSSAPKTCDVASPLIAGGDAGTARFRTTRPGAAAAFLVRGFLLRSFFVMQSLGPECLASDQTKDWLVPPNGDRYRRRCPARADCFSLPTEFPGSVAAAKATQLRPSTQ